MQKQLATLAAGATATPHRGFVSTLHPETVAPVALCGTTAQGLAPVDEGGAAGRMCQVCERGEAVLRSRVLRPEVRLLTGARSTAAGHYLIEGTDGTAYCGKQLGDDAPSGDKVCKLCESLRARVVVFEADWYSEQAGYDVEAAEPNTCYECGWFSRYDNNSAAAVAELETHEQECPAFEGAAPTDEQAEAELADTVAAIEQAEATAGTWRGEWITADEEGQQLTLDGTRPDAQQGCLFA